MKKINLLIMIAVLLSLCDSCKKSSSEGEQPDDALTLPPPPETWQEHWFEHKQVVKRIFYNDRIAVYFDDDVDTVATRWMFPFIDSVWTYTRSVYGDFGPSDTTNRLFAIFHTDKYGGGHPFMYYDDSHDNRNGIDIGSGADAWIKQTNWETNTIIHEISHVVEFISKNVVESPAFTVWGDSKWAEIFVYDVYKHLNRPKKLNDAFNDFSNGTDNFPRANTAWFRNWFYPIYTQHEEAKVLNGFFEKLAEAFPKKAHPVVGHEYERRMNLGEFVHFWSAAAGANLSTRARLAFGSDWLDDFAKAQAQFGSLKYNNEDPFFGKDLSAGAKVTVSKENDSGASAPEGSSKISDFDIQTKFFANGYTTGFWLQQQFGTAVSANTYLVSSANDAPDRDPTSWVLQGSKDGSNWTTLDTRKTEKFNYRNEFRVYTFDNANTFTHYRLNVTANAGSPDIQLGEWRLMQK
ncbi:hypothetical protein GCM10023231_21080 [Olivibacter ginsenosidimutans]|uniref:F5/8 type C domain-containing protein n=1 Tax=Olivibacter ginsenosidimutans TaxID=1176537 RepID=A0ABP9BCZ3_9SPHI